MQLRSVPYPCIVDPLLLATHARKAGSIALMGMAIPFALGIAISRIMFDTLQVQLYSTSIYTVHLFMRFGDFWCVSAGICAM